MKRNFRLVSVAMILASAFMFSCSKDDDKPAPAYAGTWESFYTDYGYYSSSKVDMKETVELTSSAFTLIEKEKVGGVYVDVEGTKGSLSSDGKIMTTKITQFGEDDDMEDTKYDLSWYKDGSLEFSLYSALYTAFGGSLTSEWPYTVSGDSLSVTIDDETKIFTKVK